MWKAQEKLDIRKNYLLLMEHQIFFFYFFYHNIIEAATKREKKIKGDTACNTSSVMHSDTLQITGRISTYNTTISCCIWCRITWSTLLFGMFIARRLPFTILSLSSLVNKILKGHPTFYTMTPVLILQRGCNLWWLSAFGYDLPYLIESGFDYVFILLISLFS